MSDARELEIRKHSQIYWCRLDPVLGYKLGSSGPVIAGSADSSSASRHPLASAEEHLSAADERR